MELFSERNKIRNSILDPEEMTEGLRNRLWNAIEEAISHEGHRRNDLIKKIWSDFYKKEVSILNGIDSNR